MDPHADTITLILWDTPGALDRLQSVRDHGPPGAWIGGGFIRNAVWAYRYGTEVPETDIDVVWFDPGAPPQPGLWEVVLDRIHPAPWDVCNQAEMHTYNGFEPFRDLEDAITHWCETATAVAACMEPDGTISLLAPYGLKDLVKGVLRPTPPFAEQPQRAVYDERVASKDWRKRWPGLTLVG